MDPLLEAHQCALCLTTVPTTLGQYSKTSCVHFFHRDCLAQWRGILERQSVLQQRNWKILCPRCDQGLPLQRDLDRRLRIAVAQKRSWEVGTLLEGGACVSQHRLGVGRGNLLSLALEHGIAPAIAPYYPEFGASPEELKERFKKGLREAVALLPKGVGIPLHDFDLGLNRAEVVREVMLEDGDGRWRHVLLGNQELALAHLKTLAEGFAESAALEVVEVSRQKLSSKALWTLFKELSRSPNLQALILADNGLEDEGAFAAASLLESRTQGLTRLELVRNGVGDAGCAYLADTLAVDQSLVYLNLEGNEIGTQGVGHLADALRFNTTLEELNLEGNLLDAESLQALVEALGANASSRVKRIRGFSPVTPDYENVLKAYEKTFPHLPKLFDAID